MHGLNAKIYYLAFKINLLFTFIIIWTPDFTVNNERNQLKINWKLELLCNLEMQFQMHVKACDQL